MISASHCQQASTRRRAIVVLALTFIVTLGLAQPGEAIINGTPDGNGHPHVGAVDVRPTGRTIPASGVLISDTVFLIAGHVGKFFTDAGLTEGRVTFEPVFDGTSGTFHTGAITVDPRYTGQINDQYDFAVIEFDTPIQGITPAQLPPLRYLNGVPSRTLRSTTYPAVGYGVSSVSGRYEGGGAPLIDRSSAGTRRVGLWSFSSLSRDWIRFDMGEQPGCIGDSGAPNFFGNSNLVVGIGISGDFACERMGSDLRLDSVSARSFLDDFVTLP